MQNASPLSPTKESTCLWRAARQIAARVVSFVLLTGVAQAQQTWAPLGGGTFDWNNNANWSPGPFPNANGAVANQNQNITGAQTINLNQNITLGILNIGDSNGSDTQLIAPGSLSTATITFDDSVGTSQINKGGGNLSTITAAINVLDILDVAANTGTLSLDGGITIGGPVQEALRKTGGGTLRIRGNLNILNTSGLADPTRGMSVNGGTTEISGSGNTVANGIHVLGGTLNFGRGDANSVISFTGGQGAIRLEAGTINIGVTGSANNTTTNVSLDIDRIVNLNGTLNLQNSTNGTGITGTAGTTTLNAGTNGTLTLDGGTTTVYRADGNALGTVVFPANAKLVLNNNATFNFTDNVNNNATPNANTTLNSAVVTMADTSGINVGDSVTGTNIPANARVLAINPNVSITLSHNATAGGAITDLSARSNINLQSITSTSNGTIMRSQAGNGTLTVGGDGVNDVFNGSLNLTTSGGNSRIIKVGAETLTLGGTVDNSSGRLEVLEGTAVLAKESSASVHALGASLVVGEPDTGVDAGTEVAQVAGTYVGTGSNLLQANFRDQIFRGVGVTVNSGAVMDLMGNFEGINTLGGTGIVRSSVAGGTLLIGENNPGTFIFPGTMVDGGGQLSFWKGGFNGDVVLTANNTYTGETLVGRNNLVLQGANGAITGTGNIYVNRFSFLRLDNNTNVNNNRVNDNANLILDQGEIRMVRNNAVSPGGNTTEEIGPLTLRNYNVIRMDHTNVGAASSTVVNVMTLNFASYNRDPGGTVSILDQAGAIFFTATNPQTANSRVTLDVLPTGSLVGTTAASNTAAADTKVLLGAYAVGNGNEFMTVQTVSGVNYIRPLQTTDYNTSITGSIAASNIPAVAGAGTYDDNLRTGADLTFQQNMAYNAIRMTNNVSTVRAVATTIADGKTLHLGGVSAIPGCQIATDGSGMIWLTGSAALTIQGGTFDFGAREALVRVDASRINPTQTATLTNNSATLTGVDTTGVGVGDRVTGTNIPGNAEIVQVIGSGPGSTLVLNVPAQQSGAITDLQVFANARIDSVITGTAGFTKTGGNTLELTSPSSYSGLTNVAEGDLRIFDDRALGLGGAGNGTRVTAGRTFTLNSGINVNNEALDLLGNSVLQIIDRNNNWNGNIQINPTDTAGQNVNMTFRAQGNGVLTVNGGVTTPGTNRALGYSDINPTYNNEAEGQQFILENYGGTGGVMNFNGPISDRLGASAAGGAAHDELNVVIRGYTGQPVSTNSDFVVNLADVSRVNGRLDLRSGFVHIGSDYAGNNPISTRGATIRLSDGGNVDRSGSVAALLMTTPGTVFRGGQINVGENSGSYSSKSTAIIGGLANSGTILFGTDQGSMDMNPIAGTGALNSVTTSAINSTITVSSTSSVAATSGATVITMSSVSGLAVGQGISGPGIQANTRITGIAGNNVTLSLGTSAAVNSGTSFTYHISPISAADTANGSEKIVLNSVVGLNIGDGISGSGVPAGTRISDIDLGTNTITITRPTTAAATVNTVYSFYNAAANTVQMSNTAGLRIGMGISGTGVPAGAIITSISPGATPTDPGSVTLSVPLNNFAGSNTSYTLPLPGVAYQTINRAAGGVNVSGGTVLQLFSVAGLSVGTLVTNTGTNSQIAQGTRIVSIDPATDQVTLSNPLGGNVGNVAINFQKVSNFAESRLYAPEGGMVDFQMRLLDDGGFGLQNEIGAITKVGRGTVQLSGSGAGAGDVDGGVNLFGGTLLFSYDNLNRNNSRVNGVANNTNNNPLTSGPGISNSPYQLTLAGGDLLLRDDEARNTVESLRGTLTIRPGHSVIDIQGANSSQITLHLGYNNDFPIGATAANPLPDPNLYWREPDRFAGGTMQIFYDGTGTGGGGAARAFYSQNAPVAKIGGGDVGGGVLGFGSIIPYTSIKLDGGGIPTDHVDFAIFFPVADLASGGSSTIFADAEGVMTATNSYDPQSVYPTGQGDLTKWANAVKGLTAPIGQGNYGYMTDSYIGGTTPFSNSLTPNSGSDFVGARVVRFVADAANNTLQLGTTTRLVLGTNGDSTYQAVGGAVRDGGAILISDLVSASAPHDQFIKGGSLTSAYSSSYFSQSVMPGPYTQQAAPAVTSNDLTVFNYNPTGVAHIESAIVNYNLGTPLNLVLAGPGTTHLQPTATNTYTGVTYLNDSTLWVSDGSKFGNGTGAIYMNGGTLEFAHDVTASRATAGIAPTLASSRTITLGGDGGSIRTTAAGTTLTYGGTLRSEDNILPLRLAEHNPTANYGVGDFIKEGQGRLVLTNDVVVGGAGWNAYYGLTEVNAGTLQLNINTANSGILGSNDANLDRTIIRAAGKLELQMNGITASSDEWIELDGGTLGTTPAHVDGSLNGVITVGASSGRISVLGGSLRLSAEAGFLTGTGDLFKSGAGTLYLNENSPDFSGDWLIEEGRVVGRSQGTPLGQGGQIQMGSIAATGGVAELYLESRTTGAVFNTEFVVEQDIIVNPEASGTQVKRIGARDFDDSTAAAQQFDRYSYKGGITLNDELVVSYADNTNNTGIPGAGADRIIALDGGIVGGAGNLRTEIIYAGGHVPSADKDLRVTFELNGDSTGWGGDLFMGNSVSDLDLQHFVRLGNNNALKSDNDVNLSLNNSLQAGGRTVTAGNLLVVPGGIAAGTGAGTSANGIVVENAALAAGTITFTQTVNEQWDVLFRDGTTPVNYVMQDCPISSSLSIGKEGLATAVITQNNTYSGTTLVSAGTLQVGSGGTTEVAPGGVGAGQAGNGRGETGLGSTRVLDGAMLSGTGLVNGLLNAPYSSITTTNGSNQLIFSNPANLSIGQTVASSALTGGSGVITAINGYAVTVSSNANSSGSSATATVTTNHDIEGLLSPGDGHQVASSTLAASSGSTTISVDNAGGLVVGMRVYGTGIAAGTTISSVAGAVVTLSTPTVGAALLGADYSFGAAGTGSIGTLSTGGNVDATLARMLMQVSSPTGNYSTPLDLIVGGPNYATALSSIVTTFGTANPLPGTHDHLQINGGLLLAGTSLVSVVDAGATYAVGNVFNLLDWVSILPGGFDTGGLVRAGGLAGDLELPTLSSATMAWDTSKFLTDGVLVVVAVPEPGRILLIGLGTALSMLRRRRR